MKLLSLTSLKIKKKKKHSYLKNIVSLMNSLSQLFMKKERNIYNFREKDDQLLHCKGLTFFITNICINIFIIIITVSIILI